MSQKFKLMQEKIKTHGKNQLFEFRRHKSIQTTTQNNIDINPMF